MDEPVGPRFTDPQGLAPGRFCTLINIGHTAEFFALDFRAVTPEGEACLLGRFFLTPQHAKRLMHALAENVGGFEQEYGLIEPNPNAAANEPSAN
ncbi:MAG: DUF3467 domain-containing protein [Deltaproteobacteria bacterium]|nr:DUF3467 domain-containing protein [Deltaproteobacteria bacterium]